MVMKPKNNYNHYSSGSEFSEYGVPIRANIFRSSSVFIMESKSQYPPIGRSFVGCYHSYYFTNSECLIFSAQDS